MLWEVEILPRLHDPDKARVCREFELLCHRQTDRPVVDLASHGYLLEGELTQEDARRLLDELLLDGLVEDGRVGPLSAFFEHRIFGPKTAGPGDGAGSSRASWIPRPKALPASGDLAVRPESVCRVRRYYVDRGSADASRIFSFARCWPTTPSNRLSKARCTWII